MRNRNDKARGAEVRVSRAKSRVTARKRVAAKYRKPREHGKTAGRRLPESDGKNSMRLRRATAADPLPGRRSHKQDGELQEKRKEKKLRRESMLRGDGRKKAPAAVEARGQDGKDVIRRQRSSKKKSLRPHAEAAAGGVEKASGAKKDGRAGKPVRILLLGVLLTASLAAMLWVYTATGVLNVTSVEVRGNEVLGEEYLRSLSGITRDTHLLKMDVKAVESALLSEPYIASVDVSRHYPHTVVLEIRERKPTGYILQNGKYNFVDQEGVVLESVDVRPAGLVEIKDLEPELLFPGLEISGRDFTTVTSLLGSLPAALREIATAVGLNRDEGLYLEAKNTLVIYGEASDLGRKNTIALLALTGLVEAYGAVEYIDISFPDHPVIKPVGAG